jgi:uncharacterized membrane protein
VEVRLRSLGNPRSTARIAGYPIHAMRVPIPIVCFVGTFVTDLAYGQTAAMMWAGMSAWLLTAASSFLCWR